MRTKFRPSHADFTYQAKFGIRAWEGGGRASARETVGRVAAGVLARKTLRVALGTPVEIVAYVKHVHGIVAEVDPGTVTTGAVHANIVRCPDPDRAPEMIAAIDEARRAGDSLGGIVEAVARGVPAGWGEPIFDKLDADLAKAMLSLPAAKGFEVGSGFAGIALTGSAHNDPSYAEGGRARTRTNHSGGIQGGISNGEDILIRVAFKPTATILREQATVDQGLNDTTIKARGRHDPCVLPRAVPIVEAMMPLVLADHGLRQRGQCGRGADPPVGSRRQRRVQSTPSSIARRTARVRSRTPSLPKMLDA